MIGLIKFKPDENKLTYRVYEYKGSTTKEFILSNNVSSFDCNTDKVLTENIIEYEIVYQVEDETWEKTNEFTFRNDVRVVDAASEVFGY
jgi:hypothetical protein